MRIAAAVTTVNVSSPDANDIWQLDFLPKGTIQFCKLVVRAGFLVIFFVFLGPCPKFMYVVVSGQKCKILVGMGSVGQSVVMLYTVLI